MNKPLKWLQRPRRSASIRCVCWYVGRLHMLKPELQTRLNYCCWIWFRVVWNKHTQDAVFFSSRCAPSLCSLRLSFYLLCSDMFLSPSPKFPSFRARSEVRDSDLPRGWVKDSPPPSPPWEMCCPLAPLHLFILYTPESLILAWITWQRAERAAASGFRLYFGLLGWTNKCPAACYMESLCVTNQRSTQKLKILKSDFDSTTWMALV